MLFQKSQAISSARARGHRRFGDYFATAVDNRAVLAQVDAIVCHRGEQFAQAGILPPAGRAEQDTTVMQSADLIKNFALNELFPILQQGAVQIAANHFYHICFP